MSLWRSAVTGKIGNVGLRRKHLDPDRHLRDAVLGELQKPFLDEIRRLTNFHECNLLCLSPSNWAVDWLSSTGWSKRYRRESELPQVEVPTLPSAEYMHPHLFSEALRLIRSEPNTAFTWAQRQLGKCTFPLGGYPVGAPRHALWCPTYPRPAHTMSERCPTLFQTALEWAATRYDTTVLEDDEFLQRSVMGWRGDDPRYGSLQVDGYANRPGLIDRGNYLQFLAEHIRIVGQSKVDMSGPKPISISSHFTPIRALGQWRAAIDLKVLCTDKTGGPPGSWTERVTGSSVFIVAATEKILSYAILSAFRSCIDTPNHIDVDLTSVTEYLLPFSILWWAKEMVMVHRGRIKARLCRNAEGVYQYVDGHRVDGEWWSGGSWSSGTVVRRRRLAGPEWAGGLGEWAVCLNLDKLPLAGAARQSWGFDHVYYRAPLMDEQLREEEWVNIESVVVKVLSRILQARSYLLEANEKRESYARLSYISHGIGNALNVSSNRLFKLLATVDELDSMPLGEAKSALQAQLSVVRRVQEEAQGLAYFARNGLKELEGDAPRTWRLGSSEKDWDRTEAIGAVQQVVEYYLGSYEPTRLSGEIWIAMSVDGSDSKRSIHDLAQSAYLVKQLCLPPFSRTGLVSIRGGAPLFLLTLGLAEILRNARQHLVDGWEAWAQVLDPTVPRLSVRIRLEENGDVFVELFGIAKDGHNLHSRSLERIIRAERSLPPHRRLTESRQAEAMPHLLSEKWDAPGLTPTRASWRLFAARACPRYAQAVSRQEEGEVDGTEAQGTSDS